MGAPIEARLAALLGGRWSARPLHASGFCDTWQATDARGSAVFVKASADDPEALEAEADGLEALRATATLRVPAVAACARDDEGGLLALEWLALRAPGGGFGLRLGHALAALHRQAPGEPGFGWHRDNRLGATPQRNRCHADWIEFLRRERLGALRERLAARAASPALLEAVDAVCERLPAFFADGHRPRPSLVHGDLWSGNWGALDDGTPVVFDPAVSRSDAEAELAMMELFGAPPEGFWPAYRDAAGLHPGYAERRGLYRLYHLLNHALLFGGGYGAQALATARRLLASGAG